MVSAIRMQIRAGTYGRDSDLANFAKFVDKVYLPFAREHHAHSAHDEFRCQTLKEEFGKLRLRDITTMRVESFINKRLKTTTVRVDKDAKGKKTPKPRSPTTVRKEVTLLSQIFNMARTERLVTENPCDFIRKAVKKKIPARRKRERFLSLPEEALLLPQLVGRREHLLTAFRLAPWTGMRRGEILRLRRSDLNLSGVTVIREVGGQKYEVPAGWLFVERSKNGKPRAIPMAGKVRVILESLGDDATRGGFLFESPVGGKAMTDIKTGFTNAVRASGLRNLTFHDLRHTWPTRAEELGVPRAVRRDILGHSPVTMTDSYTHSSYEARERAVELVAAYGETETNEKYVKNAERPTPWLASRTA